MVWQLVKAERSWAAASTVCEWLYTFCANLWPMTYDSAECSSRETNFSTSISNVESLGSQLRRLSQVVTMFLMSWIGIFLRAAAHIAKSTNDLPAFWLTSLLHKALIQSLLLLRFLHFSAAAKIASMGNVFNCKSEKKVCIAFKTTLLCTCTTLNPTLL